MYRITAVEPVRHPVLKITYEDGYSGEYDLSGFISRAPLFERLNDPEYFRTVTLGDQGRSFGWSLEEIGEEIDFCPDATRITLETQDVQAMANEFERQHRPAAE
jgi:hypothetical protein